VRGRFLAAAVVVAAALGCDDGDKPRGADGAADGPRDAGDASAAGAMGDAPPGGGADGASVEGGPGSAADGGAAIDVKGDVASEVGGDAPVVPDGPAPTGTRQLDLVFLVDNSVSMREEQDSLRQAFPAFMSVLQSLPGGLPDIRIGIVSSNFGAGPTMPSPECPPIGDRGVFQVRPSCGLDAGTSRWLAVDAAGRPNFAGTVANLPPVFGCLAQLGTNGCGYEHQLQALRAALTETVATENKGFLRREAALALVIVSDEDDCSGEPDARLYEDPSPGQAGSLRCSLTGHVCGGQPVPAMAGFDAPLASCTPAMHANTAQDRMNRLINVSDFVDYIKAMKPGRQDLFFVGAIIGWNDAPDARYGIIARPSPINPMDQEIDNMPVCQTAGTGVAVAGIRLRTFAQAFPRHSVHSICAADLTPAMTAIATGIAGMMAP
jgi:hypothetical protein